MSDAPASTIPAAGAGAGAGPATPPRRRVGVRLGGAGLRAAVYGIFLALALGVAGLTGLMRAWQNQQAADQAIARSAAVLAAASERAWRAAAAAEAATPSRADTPGVLRPALAALSAAAHELERALTERPADLPADLLADLLVDRPRVAPGNAFGASLGGAAAELRGAAAALAALLAQPSLRAPPPERHADAQGAGGALDRARVQADALASAERALQGALARAADRRADGARIALAAAAVLATLLLAALAAVVEPHAGAARRQAAQLDRQALELQRLALVGENTATVVILCDPEYRVQWVNPAFTRCTGWSAAEALGSLPVELLRHPRALESAHAALRHAVAEGRAQRSELRCRRRDGSELWLELDLRPLRDEAGVLRGFVTVASDVSAHVAERRKLRLLWSALPSGVAVVSADGEIVDANRAAETLLGAARGALAGAPLQAAMGALLHDDGRPCEDDEHPALRTLRHAEALRNETIGVRLADGTLRWLLVNTEPQRDEQGRIAAALMCFIDITERRRLQQQLQASARADALTGLPNRAAVMERLVRALEHARAHPGYGFAVLFMDFDRFKQVNDTLGHAGGDELLRQIAQRLRRALRPGDEVARVDSGTDLAARLGGDEFVLVLDGVADADRVSAVAERLLREMSEPYTVLDHPVRTSASIGVVLVADGAARVEDAQALLRDADTAMYEAKRAGRGRWVRFDPAMHARLVHTRSLEQELRRALRDGELAVAYQPVVDLASGSASGVEALVRWCHPERGVLAAAEFLPTAEECGLVAELGRQVLAQACNQFADWRRRLGARAPTTLAVNVARAELEQPEFAEDLLRLLHQAGLAAPQLQLEITEASVARDETAQAMLRTLRARGVRLALDDFGSGHSSLASLHRLPVDLVKIDRSFVCNAETVEYQRVLIEATIRVARTLGITTVAEGVETEGQAALMRALGCERGQGWLYGRPMAPEEYERWRAAGAA